MKAESSSYRRILWATSIVGGATFGALIVGLARNKAVALIGGPEAIGLLGLFTVLVSMAAALAGLGLGTSAVRQLSQHVDDPAEAGRTRWAIWSLACTLAFLGAAAVLLLRKPLAALVIGNSAYSDEVGWLSVGVAATLVASAQIAIIQAYRRIADVARIQLWGSVVATVASVAAIYRWGMAGIVVAAIAIPVANSALALWMARRLPPATNPTRKLPLREWRVLGSLGAAAMLAAAIGGLIQLAVRTIVTRESGLEAAGLYHASEAILSVNLTLILNAMAADYYPRLSQAARDPGSMELILNQQLHVVLVLAAPVLILVSVAAPLVLQLLYSSEFSQADFLMRLLVAGAVLRLPIFALGFLLLARGAGAWFVLGEAAAAAMLPVVWLAVSQFGLPGAGVGVLLASLVTCAVYLARARQLGVRMDRANLGYVIVLPTICIALAFTFQVNMWAGVLLGCVTAAALALHSYRELRSIARS